jgi:hypothetical protein
VARGEVSHLNLSYLSEKEANVFDEKSRRSLARRSEGTKEQRERRIGERG